MQSVAVRSTDSATSLSAPMQEAAAKRISSGDANARFKSVVLPHLDDAYALARWLTGSRADSEDVVQDACLRALRGIGGFSHGNARAWVLTIVRHTTYSWLRKNRPAAVALVEDFETYEAWYIAGGTSATAYYATQAAHDGLYGLDDYNGNDWIYRNDAGAQVRAGDTLSVWLKFSGAAVRLTMDGPVYVGRAGDRERGDLLPGGWMAVAPGGFVGGCCPVPVDQHEAVTETEFVAVRLDGCDHARLPR